MDKWMRSNLGKIVTIYNIPALVNKAYLTAFTLSNIQAGFKSISIYPFWRDIFDESNFAPSELNNCPNLNQAITESQCTNKLSKSRGQSFFHHFNF